jgi:hypothetical protein
MKDASGLSKTSSLEQRLGRITNRLPYDAKFGYLPALLQRLGISPASQLLVYSKTSGQRERISPKTPRAIYFNDQAYVAWIPGSPLLEVSCVDPQVGAVFFTMAQETSASPALARRDQCLECHTSNQSLNVPGYLVRSYATDGNGVVDVTQGCSMIDHRTPLAERWGGWYLFGKSTSVSAKANANPQGANPQGTNQPAVLGSSSLNQLTDLSQYLEPSSDLVALLVLEHQAHMQNLITRMYHEAMQRQDNLVQTDSEKGVVYAFLRYLLFVDEARLDVPVTSASEFTSHFEKQGPKDKLGRSLRQFDLRTRLFQYPCSYMIYSEAFDALPRDIKLHVYHRLWRILNGEDSDPAFRSIPLATRRAILEILIGTKTDVPIEWKL